MSRRPLALALAMAALLPASAYAEDLLQTYELARTGDPQYAAAESQRLADKEGAVQARGALLPQINGSARLTRSHSNDQDGLINTGRVDGNGNPIRIPSNGVGRSRGRSYGAELSQSVFDWGAISNVRVQRALSKAADFTLDNAGGDLITRTANTYFNVLVQIETLAAAEAAEAAAKRNFDYADKRLEVGLAPITDVHEARANYDSARAATILQRNALQDAYQALTEITGTRVVDLKALPDDFRPELPSEQGVDTWVSSALSNNPGLKSAEYQSKSAALGVDVARAGHLPTLGFNATYGRNTTWGSNTSLGAIDGSDGHDRTIGLTLTVPIFSGGVTQSRVRQAIANRDVAQDTYEQQKRALERNTRNAYQALVAGVSEVEARRLAVVSAKAAYDASQVGLEVGTRTVLDVLINQQNLFDAQTQYAVAKYQFLQNRLLLDQAAGSLDIEDVRDVNRLLTADANAQLAPDKIDAGPLPTPAAQQQQ
ncbi:TolC family outer membrane protein [Luteimonas aquatica]|uniref:TolC family outer membrane protein n=1 Tax=Luteimonas aquatica TaxID=450364 RepID=UPI001F58DE64|nr:TolC family outer membrane protein [Luteimonas aquatica]